MTAAIEVAGLSKKYVIGRQRESNDTLRDAIAHRAQRLAGRLFGRQARNTGEGPGAGTGGEEFWALRELDFQIREGERIGIVGRNGAGKSTLLKILSRITHPTTGKVIINGRVASLLEVGTGFHPELTGRENVYLNGAILGMSRRDIRARFDEIVEFAEMRQFIDTPVKRYSSGMTVRLAFAVAAHLEPDILIADEILAVGDAAFQRKSLGKMDDVAKQGRTVLFVSHNLGTVRNLCGSVLLIESGRLKFQGPTEEGLSIYERGLSNAAQALDVSGIRGPLSEDVAFDQLFFRQHDAVVSVVDPTRDFTIELGGFVPRAFPSLEIDIGIYRDGFHLGSCHDAPIGTAMREGRFRSRFHVPGGALKPGRYMISVGAVGGPGDWAWGSDVAVLEVAENWGDDSLARDRGAIGFRYSAERLQ